MAGVGAGSRARRFRDLLVSRTEDRNALRRHRVGRERNGSGAQGRLVCAVGRIGDIERRIEGGDGPDELRVVGRDARRVDMNAVGLGELRGERLLALG